jgi:hypothetical protein
MAYVMRTENMFNLRWRTVNKIMVSVGWHGVHTLLYGRVEEFFEFVIVVVIVVIVVIVMIVVHVEKISESVFVVIVGVVMIVMIVMTVKTVKKSSKFVFVMIVFVMTVKTGKNSSEFVIVEVRHKFLPRETDVLESAVKVYGSTPLRVHEALPDHVRHFQELAVCHEGIQLVVVSAEHRDV